MSDWEVVYWLPKRELVANCCPSYLTPSWHLRPGHYGALMELCKILQQWPYTGSNIVPEVIVLHLLHPGERSPPPLSFYPSRKWFLQIKPMTAGVLIFFFTSLLKYPAPHFCRKFSVSCIFYWANTTYGWQFKNKCLFKYINMYDCRSNGGELFLLDKCLKCVI